MRYADHPQVYAYFKNNRPNYAGMRKEKLLSLSDRRDYILKTFNEIPLFGKLVDIEEIKRELSLRFNTYIPTTPEIQGWMNPFELQWLYEKAQDMESIVEVGCWKGKSTHALLSGCYGVVHVVDNFKGNESEREGIHREAAVKDLSSEFMLNVSKFSNFCVYKMDSKSAANFFAPKSVDMIFIDGERTKSAVIENIDIWKPKCKKLLCGHDVDYQEVRDALNERNIHFENNVSSIWYSYIDKEQTCAQ